MNYRNELDNIYSELINKFKDNNEIVDVLDLIDELQNKIEDLTPNN